MRKQRSKNLQVISMNGDSQDPSRFPGMIIPKRKVLRPKDILRMQSQLVSGFISGKIQTQDAKDLSYLCGAYLTSLQTVELESRLENIESKLVNEGKL